MLKKLLFLFAALPMMAFAGSGGPRHPSSTGLHLLNGFWRDMAAYKIDKISNYMSSQFQGVYVTTAMDKAGELNLIRDHTWLGYSLTNFQQTQRENGVGAVLTLTYQVHYTYHIYLGIPKGLLDTTSCVTTWRQIKPNVWRLMSHTETVYNQF